MPKVLASHTEKLIDAISTAMGELQSLRDEVTESADALEEKFSSTARYEQLRETADSLDNFCEDEPTVPDCVAHLEVSWQEQRRRATRPDRRDWAAGILASCRDEVDEWIGQNEKHEKVDDAQELSDALDNMQGEAEALEFPGMYA